MLEIQEESEPSDKFKVLIKPNNSISKTGVIYILLIFALLLLVVAMSFALIGAWPVIVYAVLTILALSLGFNLALKRASDYESLSISAQQVSVERQMGNVYSKQSFNRYWLQVSAEHDQAGDCICLCLRSHGKSFEFGRNLCYDERDSLSQKLKARLGTGFY